MTLTIDKKTKKEDLTQLLLKFKKETKKKSLWKVYGKFTFEGDALEIQKKLRNEWN